MTHREVKLWVRTRTTKKVTSRFGTFIRPSTAEYRRWLRAKDTPREVKNYIYSALRYRRQR